MLYFTYIGRYDNAIKKLSSLLKDGSFFATATCDKAIMFIDKMDNKHNSIILYEQVELKSDIKNIKNLRNRFPKMDIILVFDKIEANTTKDYLLAGVNNTLSIDITNENVSDLISFHKKKSNSTIHHYNSNNNINVFKLPLWKRSFDIIFSSCAILALSPILLATTLAIRLESKGKIVYKSKRVGSNYKVFDFLKFRSMYENADQRLKEFNNLNQYQDRSEERRVGKE